MRHKYWILLIAVLALAVILVGCTSQPDTEVQEQATEAAEPEEEAPPPEEPAEEPAGEVDRSRTVIFDIDGGRVADPELWNQFVPGSRRDHGYHQAMAEPLFILNYETGEIEPWLGESMTSNDTLDVWTLTLRDGVKWSDGEVFNADDVVFTVNMLLDNAPELVDSAAVETWVEGVEKIDDLTVQFNLTKPNPRFQLDFWSVRIWGGISIVPEHIWTDQDPLTFTNYDPEKGWPVFTGPYTLESVSETEFVYARDDDWWGAVAGFKPLPQPEKLVWVWYGPEETRAAAMADNQLDSLMDITLGALLALQQRNPNVVAHFNEPPYAWVPDPCSRTFEVNHTVEPWNDKDMRWALNFAIDREEIVAIAYEGSTFASRHFFPAYPPLDHYVDLLEEAGLYEEHPLLEHNPDRAKEIIESKGYTMNDSTGYYEKDGEELAIDIATHEAFIEKQRIAQVIVEQLQRIGINASNRNEAGATWSDNFQFGNFEARVGWQTCGSVNEPWASMDTFNTNWLKPVGERVQDNQNAWRWSGEAADSYSAIVDEIGSLPLGDPRIDELFVEAMGYWMAELPVIPITQAKKIIPFNTTYWTGWPTAENNYMHPPTWWQSTHMIIHNLQPAQ
ncbi:MAG: ABC transporter substrate-binding protein [Chloroflexi bacterium]|nr:ABC transporter substrate-binding protein [Chloroflexota bacterium]MCI0578970.1 ABC transporter substrate-binding protein [Chloroflexota bacterium]MCI0645092.1 ABC transporter substrate-binding protein [Chloroflexota bacterium]MCI0731927.1 ABC transporter substrate-binding protein [Chloroflexota bacterium]